MNLELLIFTPTPKCCGIPGLCHHAQSMQGWDQTRTSHTLHRYSTHWAPGEFLKVCSYFCDSSSPSVSYSTWEGAHDLVKAQCGLRATNNTFLEIAESLGMPSSWLLRETSIMASLRNQTDSFFKHMKKLL